MSRVMRLLILSALSGALVCAAAVPGLAQDGSIAPDVVLGGPPEILAGEVASHHWDSEGGQWMDVRAWADVDDPDGMATIEAVVLLDPDGDEDVQLRDDGNSCDGAPGDGRYGHRQQ